MTHNWKVIGRMLAGWHASENGCRSSGGSLESYAAQAAEGAVVYDGSRMRPAAAVRLVMSGPILNLSVQGVSRFGREHRKAAARMLPGLSGGFDTIMALALSEPEHAPESEEYGSLDRVDWPTYRRLLERAGGVRFGVVRAGVVEWETATP